MLLQLATGLKIQGPALLTFSINGDASTGAAIGGGTITGKSNGMGCRALDLEAA